MPNVHAKEVSMKFAIRVAIALFALGLCGRVTAQQTKGELYRSYSRPDGDTPQTIDSPQISNAVSIHTFIAA